MAEYKVIIKPSASKELDALGTRQDRHRIVQRIRALAGDPRPYGSQKLSGAEKYRVRCGIFRIVYLIYDGARTVEIIKVGHRRDVYR